MKNFLKIFVMLFVCSVFVSLPLDAKADTETGTITVQDIGDISSCPVRPWTPEEEELRTRSTYVEFAQSFATTPTVFLSVTLMDAYSEKNLRYYARPTSISRDGFILTFGTWCNTYIYSADISWLAFE